MSGNTTTSNNFTGLYGASGGTIVPTTPYGNANVVGLLAAGTDGGNTVANIVASGNISGNYFLGNGSQLTGIASSYGNANVTSLLANFGSNVISTTGNVTAGNVIAGAVVTPTVYNQGMATQGYDYVQMQYSNSVTLPVSQYDIGTGSWFYLDPGGGVFQSNTTGTLETVVLGNDGSVSATGNITGGGINTPGKISATGNITTAGYFVGTFLGNIVGNLIVPGANTQVLYNYNGNADASAGFTFNSASNLVTVTGNIAGGNITTVGNVTGNYILGNGSQLTGLPATYGNANVVANLAALGTNPVSTTGNVSAGYFLGNGSQLTGLAATYGNANVVTLLAAFGSNTVSTTGNVTAGYVIGNGSLLTNLTGGNVTGSVAQANLANTANAVAGANVSGQVANALVAGTVYTAAQPNITSVGTLTSVAVTGNTTTGNMLTGGVVSATGNITGNYIIGNGSQLTGLPAGYSNADVATFLSAFGSNVISTSGNVTAGYFVGNGSLLSSLTGANVTGTVANATYATSAGSADLAQYVTANAQANITSVGVLTSLSVSGNITSNYFLGNGSQLTGLPATYGNANVSDFLANGFGSNVISTTGNINAGNLVLTSGVGNVYAHDVNSTGSVLVTGVVSAAGNVRGSNFNTVGLVTATGNVTGGNLLSTGTASIAGNLLSYNQTVTGLANAASASANSSNITIAGINIASDTVWDPDSFAVTNNNIPPGRVMIGTGYNGNMSMGVDPNGNVNGVFNSSRLAVVDSINRTNTGRKSGSIGAAHIVNLTANVTNTSFRAVGTTSAVVIGGGSAANTIAFSSTNPGIVNGGQFNVYVGNVGVNVTGLPIGNTIVNYACAINGGVITYGASRVLNAFITAGLFNPVSSNTVVGNTAFGNAIGFTVGTNQNNGTNFDNVIGFYMPGNTATYGIATTNGMRTAANGYYFLKCDDNVAQSGLGSLRAYHSFQYGAGNTGTVNINKANGQVQYLNPTGDITIGSYSNFVTTATTSLAALNQSDTVTLIIEQGATPYTVTMPTGNSAIRYANGVSTVTATANTTTMIAITAYRTSANATGYLTTISPAFS